MYSTNNAPTGTGLGFDFSEITNLVKTALPVGLNIYQQQVQLKQIKAANKAGLPSNIYVPPAIIGQSNPAVPMSATGQGQVMVVPQPIAQTRILPIGQGINMSTVLLVGGAVVGAAILFKMLR